MAPDRHEKKNGAMPMAMSLTRSYTKYSTTDTTMDIAVDMLATTAGRRGRALVVSTMQTPRHQNMQKRANANSCKKASGPPMKGLATMRMAIRTEAMGNATRALPLSTRLTESMLTFAPYHAKAAGHVKVGTTIEALLDAVAKAGTIFGHVAQESIYGIPCQANGIGISSNG